MDAVEFLKEKKRMCDSVTDCKHCPIGWMFLPQYTIGNYPLSGGDSHLCCDNYCFESKDKNSLVQKVEQWSKEHPRKTRLQDFLEKYPKAPISSKGVPTRFCPQDIGYKCKYECNHHGKTPPECWNEPVED